MKRVFLVFTLMLALVACQKKAESLTQYIDPKIGSGGHGHVFVGASVPFGAVQVGLSNFNKGWGWCSSYHASDSITRGFTHLNLNGTGRADLGEIAVLPTVGKRRIMAGNQERTQEGFSCLYSKKTEVIKPNYYSVKLDDYDIKVELSATERVGIHKYTFPENKEARVIVDLGEGNGDKPTETYIHQISETVFEGYRFSAGWANDEREFFALVLSKPVVNFVIYDGEKEIQTKDIREAKGVYVKGFLEFSTTKDEVVYLKMGISPVSMKNAMINIEKELPKFDFDKVVSDADDKWNKELSKVVITTKNEAQKHIFYTALYHTMITPSIFNDVNGEYRGADKNVYRAPGFTNYTTFSLWDTYRAEHPLFTITQPERVSDMINTMLNIFKQTGKLPYWHLKGCETNSMIGYGAIPVIVDACLKGFEGIDVEEAYNAIKTTATGNFRFGEKEIIKYGYIPADSGSKSIACAMEYAISDWAIAKLAEKLGKKEDAKFFAERALGYRKYFDTETKFFRGKLLDGTWRTPFNPMSAVWGDDYCEGNAWQYLWMMPQDPEGLIALLGGDKPFTDKLDELFSMSSEIVGDEVEDITGLIGQYAHGNEPSHQTAYMYVYAGAQLKTAEKVDYIMNNLYTDKPDGISGNEDCGQMSAWYVFSAMGFYPVNPSSGMYVFGRPLFDKVTINLPQNKAFVIIAKNNGTKNIYIQSAVLNGKDYTKSFITHKDLMNGGELIFTMGEKPSQFGNKPEDRPKSMVY